MGSGGGQWPGRQACCSQSRVSGTSLAKMVEESPQVILTNHLAGLQIFSTVSLASGHSASPEGFGTRELYGVTQSSSNCSNSSPIKEKNLPLASTFSYL